MLSKQIIIEDNNSYIGEIKIVISANQNYSDPEILAQTLKVLKKSCDNCNILIYKGLIINLDNKTVFSDGIKIDFTKTEFDLLAFLLKNSGKIFSRNELVATVWPHNVVVCDRTVDVNMTRIRKKIGTYSSNIVSRPGFGYMFANDK